MCDDGMLSYQRIYQDRIDKPILPNGSSKEGTMESALEAAQKALSSVSGDKVAVVLSAQHASEDNYLLAKLAREVLKTEQLYLTALADWESDDILRSSDNNPNRAGALQAAGAEIKGMDALLQAVEAGDIKAVVALGSAAAQSAEELAPLKKLSAMVCLTSHQGPLSEVASTVIPVAYYAEMDGTFVNAKGMAQRFTRAIPPPVNVKPAWQTLIDLAKAMDKPIDLADLGAVRQAMPTAAQAEAPQEESQS
jgi:NADH-quinone oxidoreductase subunit G